MSSSLLFILLILISRNKIYSEMIDQLNAQDAQLDDVYSDLVELDGQVQNSVEGYLREFKEVVVKQTEVGVGCQLTIKNDIIGMCW